MDKQKYEIITGIENKPKKITIYGPPAIGKSEFGAQFPKAIFVQAEEAGGLITVPRMPLSTTMQDVIEKIRYIVSGDAGDFETLVIDSLKYIEVLISNSVCERLKLSGMGDDADYGKSVSYSEGMQLWGKFINELEKARDAGLNVVLLGHNEVKSVKDPRVPEYEMTTLDLRKWGSYNPTALIRSWSDCVFYLDNKVYTSSDKTGIDAVRTTATSTGDRIIYTEERPAYLAKNRFGMPPELPYKKGKGYEVIEKYLTVTEEND